jgi:hypothetical protein
MPKEVERSAMLTGKMKPLWESLGSSSSMRKGTELIELVKTTTPPQALEKGLAWTAKSESVWNQSKNIVANPFLRFGGRSFYQMRQRDTEDSMLSFIAYPASGLKQPTAPASRIPMLGVSGIPATEIISGIEPFSGQRQAASPAQSLFAALVTETQQIQVTTTTTKTTPKNDRSNRNNPLASLGFGVSGFEPTPGFSRVNSMVFGGFRRYKYKYPIMTAKQMMKELLKNGKRTRR